MTAKTIFSPTKQESLTTKLKRFGFNFFPAYRRTGGRIIFIASDYQEIHIKLALNWATRNYVGTVFGGSIFAAADPIYMVQLIHILGKNYTVWDIAGKVKFRKPIRAVAYAKFIISEALIADIKAKTAEHKKHIVNLQTVFEDAQGTVYAEIERSIYIARK